MATQHTPTIGKKLVERAEFQMVDEDGVPTPEDEKLIAEFKAVLAKAEVKA